MKFAALLSLALVAKVDADCACYEAGNYTGRSAPISNSYETSDFSACYKPCSFVAYSGNDTYGWTDLTFNWGTTTNSGGMVQIFDGVDISGTPLIQVNEGENVLSGSTKSQIKSSSPRITIVYSQNGVGANVFYGVIKAVPGLQPSAAPLTTTAAPTTRTFNNPNYRNDPYFITHDIFVVVNQRTNGGRAALLNLNAIAINFVTLLSTTTDINSDSSSRLSLASLTPYDPYYAVRGGIWELDSTDVSKNLPSSGVTIEGNIDEALKGLINLAFKVNTNSSTDSRKNVQRSVILLTAEWPTSNANLSVTDVKKVFDDMGVNLLVIGYNLTSTESSALLRTDDRWYNAVNALSTNTAAVASFVNAYYFNDGSQTNYWCPQHPIQPYLDGSYYLQEPYNYIGPYGSSQQWSDPFDGQTARYCNYANSQYIFQRPDKFNETTVQVFFELEAGKDFLNFYDDSSNLIASFTGYEILSSSFYTTSTSLTIKFVSDNKSVFRGFFVSITPKTA